MEDEKKQGLEEVSKDKPSKWVQMLEKERKEREEREERER